MCCEREFLAEVLVPTRSGPGSFCKMNGKLQATRMARFYGLHKPKIANKDLASFSLSLLIRDVDHSLPQSELCTTLILDMFK